MKMPKTGARAGMITPQYVFTRPKVRNSRNIGSIATWAGITIAVRSTRYTCDRPGKRSFANAYPASETIRSAPTVDTVATKALLRKQRPRSSRSKSAR